MKPLYYGTRPLLWKKLNDIRTLKIENEQRNFCASSDNFPTLFGTPFLWKVVYRNGKDGIGEDFFMEKLHMNMVVGR